MKKTHWLGVITIAAFLAAPGTVTAQFGGRGPIDRREVQTLEGRWYSNGERAKLARITSSRRGLQAINEHGNATRLQMGRGGHIVALDWQGGLRGRVSRDRIDWANGTTWKRTPSGRFTWWGR